MDIDDILAEVSAAAPGGVGGLLSSETQDMQLLTRAWVNEKCAPEVLAWPAHLMDRVLDRLRRQIELVELQTGDMDPKINFKLIIIQTELERVKYLVRSFIRTRLAKIDQHAPYYLSLPASTQSHLLSPAEQQYASSHQALLSQHFQASFLSAFPPKLQQLDATAGGISMVDGPDADGAVFVRALRDSDRRDPVVVDGTDIAFDMTRGDIWVTRWSAVKTRVERGEAELV